MVQRLAGARGSWALVAASGPVADTDTVVDMRFGLGPLALRIPCRVVYVVDEPERAGFAYGTLPGHPETGEELFLLSRLGDGPHHLHAHRVLTAGDQAGAPRRAGGARAAEPGHRPVSARR
ncbi:hypothetical protein GCM10023350_14890 [Nocardioides endophyticus]|uniref:DUF1990 domain-containing protein n=1 Tax=Nocardioides endophyticus TaxID=1353775 RepID=A0ABP8YMD4_9ACTN